MNTIAMLSPQEFGQDLERLHNLSGIPLPPDPKGTLHYVREKYGKYDATLLSDAIDWYLQGFLEDRARTINAMFVIKIFRSYLKAYPNSDKYYPKTKYIAPQKTEEEARLTAKKALGYVAESYYKVKYDQASFTLHIKAVESLYSYVTPYMKEDLDMDRLEYWEQWIKQYLERKVRFDENDRKIHSPLKAVGYERNNNFADYYKCAHVLELIQKRIDDGWTP